MRVTDYYSVSLRTPHLCPSVSQPLPCPLLLSEPHLQPGVAMATMMRTAPSQASTMPSRVRWLSNLAPDSGYRAVREQPASRQGQQALVVVWLEQSVSLSLSHCLTGGLASPRTR